MKWLIVLLMGWTLTPSFAWGQTCRQRLQRDYGVKLNRAVQRGFPDARVPRYYCEEAKIKGSHPNFRLYFNPRVGHRANQKRALIFIVKALRETYQKFAKLGSMKKVAIVYLQRFGPGDELAAVFTPSITHDVCPMRVFMNVHEGSDDKIKQVLAHELFHCFQAWNFKTAMNGGSNDEWWVEGSAEAMSDFAYPSANAENDFVYKFNGERTIFQQESGYINALYFISMIQQWGGQGLVSRLKRFTATTSGLAAQVSRWSRSTLLAQSFHLFAQQLTAQGVSDASGRKITPFKQYSVKQLPLSPMGDFVIQSQRVSPFTLQRLGVDFRKDSKYQVQFLLKTRGAMLDVSYRKRGTVAWTKTSGAIDIVTTCKERQRYEFLVTATHNLLTPVSFDISYKYKSKPCGCKAKQGLDQCLVGRWYLDRKTFQKDFGLLQAGQSKDLTLDGTSGTVVLQIQRNNTMMVTCNDFTVDTTVQMKTFQKKPLKVRTRILVQGRGVIRFACSAKGKICLKSGKGAVTISTQVYLGQSPLMNKMILRYKSGQSLRYQCTKQSLDLYIPVKGTRLRMRYLR